MATNWTQPGVPLTTANATGSTVSSGGGIVAGKSLRVAINDIANGASGPAYSEGVYQLPAAASNVWADGDLLWWNGVALTDQTTDYPAGMAVGAKASGATTANVSLGYHEDVVDVEATPDPTPVPTPTPAVPTPTP